MGVILRKIRKIAENFRRKVKIHPLLPSKAPENSAKLEIFSKIGKISALESHPAQSVPNRADLRQEDK